MQRARSEEVDHQVEDYSTFLERVRQVRQLPVAIVPPPSGPAQEMARWLADHPEVLDGYAFEWVAVADKRVVARGASFGEAADAAHEQGYDDPLLVPLFPPPLP